MGSVMEGWWETLRPGNTWVDDIAASSSATSGVGKATSGCVQSSIHEHAVYGNTGVRGGPEAWRSCSGGDGHYDMRRKIAETDLCVWLLKKTLSNGSYGALPGAT